MERMVKGEVDMITNTDDVKKEIMTIIKEIIEENKNVGCVAG